MTIAFYIVNALRFIAEVMTLIILSLTAAFCIPVKCILGLLLPACLLVIWGLFVSPKAKGW